MKKIFYETMRENTEALARAQAAQHKRFVLARTLVFPLMLAVLIHGYDTSAAGEVMLGIFLVLLFLVLVAQHQRLTRRRQFTQAYLGVVGDMLARFGGGWKSAPVQGAEYRREKRPPDQDLHIFGMASLYQYLCAARTKAGRDRLAAALTATPQDLARTRLRQAAAAELIAHPLLCLELEARGAGLPDGHDTAEVLREIAQPQTVSPALLFGAGAALSLATLGTLLWAALGAGPWALPPILCMVNLALSLVSYAWTQRVLAPLGKMAREVRLYGQIFRTLGRAPLHGDALHEILAPLFAPVRATDAQRQLATLAACVSMRRNFVFFVLANALCLWDFHCRAYFTWWCRRAGARVGDWLAVWAEMEVLLSLARVGHTRAVHTFPQFLTGDVPRLDAEGATPLLLSEETGVPNDAHLTAGTLVITGSNMSGKTTYMRTLGTNAVLAYAGAPVCAHSFALTPMAVYTSIQISDNLADGISTFYAELLRIKKMMLYSRRKKPMLILIDEIFRGTNSADRIVGAREAIRRLTLPHAITIVTTHDFELCDLACGGVPVANAHFEEHYEGDRILFDFKMHAGRCRTTNAQYLLRMAGIMGDARD
ncbi:MutS-related protein [uncultured Selenomonas sp.]|uniref:MutS-related protein n=1 Tax=uncultured Selenomonas sp. TaxID=159275 RepID=UPI0028D77DB7|nr:DNA mismatch repair protein MutS [uncultured Selenomonas sp.]